MKLESTADAGILITVLLLAGFLIAGFGPGPAFVIDALTFGVSAVAVVAIR